MKTIFFLLVIVGIVAVIMCLLDLMDNSRRKLVNKLMKKHGIPYRE